MIRGNLNPLIDPVLDPSEQFATLYAFLAREAGVANVERSLVPFGEFCEPLAQLLLMDRNGDLRSSRPYVQDQGYSEIDAIYLGDPESLLFKEWAKLDLEHSPSGHGSRFTAIANADGRPGAAINSTDYYFALTSEAAGGCHLYGIWERLQAAESKALRARDGVALGSAREGFQERATSGWSSGPIFSGVQEALNSTIPLLFGAAVELCIAYPNCDQAAPVRADRVEIAGLSSEIERIISHSNVDVAVRGDEIVALFK